MHKSVSLKLVNIIKCHLVETKVYLFIFQKLGDVERQIQLFHHPPLSQPGHWAASSHWSQKSVITSKPRGTKVRSGITDFACTFYTPLF